MTEWLNQNQGFIMAILTFVYVIATIFLAYIAWKTSKISIEAKEVSEKSKDISNEALRISEKHLKLIADLENQRVRPHIIFNLINELGFTYAVIKNYGLTAAKDVKVAINPTLERGFSLEDEKNESITTSQKFLLFPPNFEVKDSLGSSADFYDKHQEAKFEGEITYKDFSDNEYVEKFNVDLDVFKGRMWNKNESIPDKLKEINKELTGLRNIAEKLIKVKENESSKRNEYLGC